MPIDLLNFVRKWNASAHNEEAGAHDHFRDLCEALGVPHPTQEDEIGASYTYEKRVRKAGTGEQGFADVWKRGFFAWEYKSNGGDLKKAYKQLNEYHEALENPPLLVVCDFIRFEVHTKFENTPPRVYAFVLDDLLHNRDTATCALPPLEVLRYLFDDYNQLRPNVAAARVTEAAAGDFLRLAQQLELERAAGPQRHSKEQIAHFIMRLVFCLFADSVRLLPNNAFRRLVTNDRFSPIGFNKKLPVLFEAMSSKGGTFGADDIPYFNGGLFSDSTVIPLEMADLAILHSASQHDWSHIEPAIFGTLFERSLNAEKRSMIGAHYTSSEDILLLVEPVIIAPLQRRWQTVQQSVLEALAAENPATEFPGAPSQTASSFEVGSDNLPGAPSQTASSFEVGGTTAKPRRSQISLKLNRPALQLLQAWAAELSSVRILDPACGSGNFLYVALKRLLDLWQIARRFGLDHGLTLALDPIPNPTQLYGIEIDFYAHEIASIVVWIGFLQWKHDHGVKDEKEPLLEKLTNIQKDDAILRYDPGGRPYEPEWPPAEYIVGNPPFLGGKLLRRELGDSYIDDLFDLYRSRVRAESDLVVYWFEKARHHLQIEQVQRVGLLATQGIRGGANRAVLERIQQTGTIFWAWSDRKWTLAGAAVHVSMVAFERHQGPDDSKAASLKGTASAVPQPATLESAALAAEAPVLLNGQPVSFINPDLTTGSNTASAHPLKENSGLCFMGTTRIGPFEMDEHSARKMLESPVNPNGRPNSDVVKAWINATDITGQHRRMFVIDFGIAMPESQAALYQLPFEYVRHHVRPDRIKNRRGAYADKWWIFGEPRSALRRAVKQLSRYIATPMVSKHRVFVWKSSNVISENLVNVIAREDDYFFGVIHSSIHELWARAQGTQLREVESGFRYTPNSTFDTFPFPWPPGTEPSEADSPIVRAIADAARTLVQLRDAWLNPPDAQPEELRKRTLTNLYNQRPTWLANAHRALDQAVFAAYGWPTDLTTQEILANLLALNHQRAAAQPPSSKPRKPSKRLSAPSSQAEKDGDNTST